MTTPSRPRRTTTTPASAKSGLTKGAATRSTAVTGTKATAPAQKTARRQQAARQAQLRNLAPLFVVVGIVLVAVIAFVVFANGSNNTSSAPPSAVGQVTKAVTSVPASVYDTVGVGGLTNPMHRLVNQPAPKDKDGKPIMLYVGGQFCPFCAAERWSLVAALSRFGTFTHLGLTQSSPQDNYPNTNTLDFYGSSYTSTYLDFQGVEAEDGARQPLQTLTTAQKSLYDTYNNPPYTASPGFPFVDIANRYLAVTGYSPQDLSGASWQDIAKALTAPQNPMTRDIIGNANYLTAAICDATAQQPGNVCQSKTIQGIEQQLHG